MISGGKSSSLFFFLENGFYAISNLLGGYLLHAGEILAGTRLVAIDAAWTTVHIYLDGIGGILIPAHESCKRMGGTPDAYYRCVDQ